MAATVIQLKQQLKDRDRRIAEVCANLGAGL